MSEILLIAEAETEEEARRGLEGRSELRRDEALLLKYRVGRVGDIMERTPQDAWDQRIIVLLRTSLLLLSCFRDMSACPGSRHGLV